jgi:hypothetical protein
MECAASHCRSDFWKPEDCTEGHEENFQAINLKKSAGEKVQKKFQVCPVKASP